MANESAQRQIKDFTFVKFSGDMGDDLRQFHPGFFSGLLESGRKKIVLDLEEVSRMYSATINQLVQILKIIESEPGKLYLLNLAPGVHDALVTVNVSQRFEIYQTEFDFVMHHGLEDAFDTPGMGGGEIAETGPFTLKRIEEGDQTTVKIKGALLDAEHRKSLWDEIDAVLAGNTKKIVLDFEKTEFVDSIALGELVAIHRVCAKKGVTLLGANPSDVVGDAFRVTDVGRLLGM